MTKINLNDINWSMFIIIAALSYVMAMPLIEIPDTPGNLHYQHGDSIYQKNNSYHI